MSYSPLLYHFDRHYFRFFCRRVYFVELEQARRFSNVKECVNMFGDLRSPVSMIKNGHPGMQRPVECRRLERLCLSHVRSLIGRCNLFLCVYRRLCVQICFHINSGPGGLRCGSATCSYHGCLRYINFRCLLSSL